MAGVIEVSCFASVLDHSGKIKLNLFAARGAGVVIGEKAKGHPWLSISSSLAIGVDTGGNGKFGDRLPSQLTKLRRAKVRIPPEPN